MPRIVLATANPHKVEELRAIFAADGRSGLALAGLDEFGPVPEPPETGRTFEENAALKAAYYAGTTGAWSLADDSGLEIDALDGRPGVISSHYSTDGREEGLCRAARDQANNARVLRELEGVPPQRRGARFVCVMVLAEPGGRIVARSRGTFEGRIGLPGRVPRGAGGFGYDPIFLVAPDFVRTSAELSPADKNTLSHRGRAARAMAARLAELFRPRGA